MLTLNDGRAELWQWDTGRTLAVDADCSQVHFSNKVFGRSIDVDVADGVAIIPDILLQTDKDLNVWAFVGTAENGYTKISKTFKVNRRNKPADYVFTPPDQTTLAELSVRIDRIEESQDPDAIKNAVEDYLQQNPVEAPVQSVNGQTGTVELTAEDVGAISQDDLQEATNEVLAQAKASGEFDGADGADGKDGAPGQDGAPGADGKDGITPTIGSNGNWYLGDTDTGKPSRGETGPKGEKGEKGDTGDTGPAGPKGDTGATGPQGIQGPVGPQGPQGEQGPQGIQGETGPTGADGKSAYQYAQEGGYTGTETEFVAKLAQEMPTALPNPNALTFTGAATGTYDGSAPLTVNIPDGGGSSDTWELINTITVGDDAPESVTLSADSNGNAFALKKFYLITTTAPKNTYFTVRINNKHWTEQFSAGNLSTANVSANNPIRIIFQIVDNGFYKLECANNNNIFFIRDGERSSSGGVQSHFDSVFSVSFVWGAASPYAVGDVFTLYGVRT